MSDALNHEDLVLAHDLAGEILELGSSASLDRSPKKNWVENSGNLPPYVREVAREIEKSGKTLSTAIAIAISRIKKWAVTGKPETKAKAIKALAQWEALKAKNKAKKAAKKSDHALAASNDSEGVELTRVKGYYRKTDHGQVWVPAHVDGREAHVEKVPATPAPASIPTHTPSSTPKVSHTPMEWSVVFHDHSNDTLEKRRVSAEQRGDHEHVEAISAEQARRSTVDDLMARYGVDADIQRITDFELRNRMDGVRKGVPVPRQDVHKGDWLIDVMGPHQVDDEDELDKGPGTVNKLNKQEYDRLTKEMDRRSRVAKRPDISRRASKMY